MTSANSKKSSRKQRPSISNIEKIAETLSCQVVFHSHWSTIRRHGNPSRHTVLSVLESKAIGLICPDCQALRVKHAETQAFKRSNLMQTLDAWTTCWSNYGTIFGWPFSRSSGVSPNRRATAMRACFLGMEKKKRCVWEFATPEITIIRDVTIKHMYGFYERLMGWMGLSETWMFTLKYGNLNRKNDDQLSILGVRRIRPCSNKVKSWSLEAERSTADLSAYTMQLLLIQCKPQSSVGSCLPFLVKLGIVFHCVLQIYLT